MSDAQLPLLFGAPEPVSSPQPAARGSRKPEWTRLTSSRQPCHECKDEQRTGARTTVAANARWKRKQGGSEVLLCAAHARPRRERDNAGNGAR